MTCFEIWHSAFMHSKLFTINSQSQGSFSRKSLLSPAFQINMHRTPKFTKQEEILRNLMDDNEQAGDTLVTDISAYNPLRRALVDGKLFPHMTGF